MTTFASEDKRKDKLFEAWIEYLTQLHNEFYGIGIEYDDTYEGLAKITKISENYIDVKLDDKRKIRGLPVTSKISKYLSKNDTPYFILGRKDGRWNFIDVISIGTIIGQCPKTKLAQVHFTINPLIARPQSHA